jgi:hypothetical protein
MYHFSQIMKIVQESIDELKKCMHQPKIIFNCYNFNVSQGNANTMAFKGKHAPRTIIVNR